MPIRDSISGSPIVVLLLVVPLLLGCGEESSGPQIDPVTTVLEQGWSQFTAGEYTGAIAKFGEAVAMSPGLGDGHNGLGWTYLRLDSLDVALDQFDLAVAKGFVAADAQAGRCLVLNRIDEYRQAIFAGEAALEIDDLFVLDADITIDVRDVRLAMAQSYLSLGEYEEALDQIMTVDASILINPNSGTFVQELVVAIEDLTADLSVF